MSTARERKRASERSERAVARDLGGRRVFNSGTGLEKCDGRVMGKFRIENKITEKDKYTLTAVDWTILWNAAVQSGELPVFHIRMRATQGPEQIVVVSKNWWLEHGGTEGDFRPVNEEGPAKSHCLKASAIRGHTPYCFWLGRKRAAGLGFRPELLVVLEYPDFLRVEAP